MVKFLKDAFIIEFYSSSPAEEYVVLTKSLLEAIKSLPPDREVERYWLCTLLQMMLLREEQMSKDFDTKVGDRLED